MEDFRNKIKNVVNFYFGGIGEYFVITKKDTLKFFQNKFFVFNKAVKPFVINFIVTSKAEIRVFTPLVQYILNKNLNIFVNIFFSKKELSFNKDLERRISNNNKVNIRNSSFHLLNSILNSGYVNVICLDHEFYSKPHQVGIGIIDSLKTKGAKTVCIQHGGNQEDNILGQMSSKSSKQIVFGKIIYDRLVESTFRKNDVYLTGNPLHDKLQNIKVTSMNKLNRKVVSLITCLHTEYDDRENPEKCYRDYVINVFKSVDYSKYMLLIKMHPYDSLEKNIYEEVRSELEIKDTDINIFYSDDEENTVYDIINISDLVLSRASSIIEEALMLNKKVVAYDLFKDGCSKYYDFLLKYNSYRKVIGGFLDLKPIIDDLILKSKPTDMNLQELIYNTTYKLDGKSSERIVNVLRRISSQDS